MSRDRIYKLFDCAKPNFCWNWSKGARSRAIVCHAGKFSYVCCVRCQLGRSKKRRWRRRACQRRDYGIYTVVCITITLPANTNFSFSHVEMRATNLKFQARILNYCAPGRIGYARIAIVYTNQCHLTGDPRPNLFKISGKERLKHQRDMKVGYKPTNSILRWARLDQATSRLHVAVAQDVMQIRHWWWPLNVVSWL